MMVNPLIFNINPKMIIEMKRQIKLWGMMLAAAFTLTNCAKEIEGPVQEPETVGYPFEIVASTVDTKTVNNDMATNWVAGDQISLIHKESENEEAGYVYEEAFTIASDDLAEGRFTGKLAAPLTSGNLTGMFYIHTVHLLRVPRKVDIFL